MADYFAWIWRLLPWRGRYSTLFNPELLIGLMGRGLAGSKASLQTSLECAIALTTHELGQAKA